MPHLWQLASASAQPLIRIRGATIFSPGFCAMSPFSHRPPLARHAGRRAAWPWFGSSMLRSITAALGAALLLAGCVAGPEVTAGPDPADIARVTSSAAAQVRRCYRSPRVLSEARQIVTRLRVRFAPDGTLVEVPTVLAQLGLTPVNRPYAGAMAAA
jgi:hypothetical protein